MNEECRLLKVINDMKTKKAINRLCSALTTVYYINWHNNFANRSPKCTKRYNMKKSLTTNINYISVPKLMG
jgi:hypothetical protein